MRAATDAVAAPNSTQKSSATTRIALRTPGSPAAELAPASSVGRTGGPGPVARRPLVNSLIAARPKTKPPTWAK